MSAPADRGVGRPAGRRRGPRGSTRPRTVSSWFVLKGVDMVSSSYTSTPKDQQSTAVVWPLHVSTGRARRGVVARSVSRARVDRAAGMGLRPRTPPFWGNPPGGPGRAGPGRVGVPSGATYSGVPQMVIDCLRMDRAHPKSMSTGYPYLSSTMFSGLTSLCAMFLWWRKSSALMMPAT